MTKFHDPAIEALLSIPPTMTAAERAVRIQQLVKLHHKVSGTDQSGLCERIRRALDTLGGAL